MQNDLLTVATDARDSDRMADAVRILCTEGAMSLHDAIDALTPPRAPQVGDILACGWGYGQTRYAFYRVTKVTAKSVRIVPIGKRYVRVGSHGAAEVLPDVASEGRGKPMLRRFEYAGDFDFVECAGPTQRIYPERADSEVFGQPLTRINTASKYKYYVAIASYSTAYLWDGTLCLESGDY